MILINIGITFAWNKVLNNNDDGTEVNESDWYEDGFRPSVNCLGRYFNDETYTGGYRFRVDNLSQGEEIAYARLRFAARGSNITSMVKLLIEGVLQKSPTAFSTAELPSQKTPKTKAKIGWQIKEPWLRGSDDVPLYYSSPNIAPIINEILSLPAWGTGAQGKTLIITIKDSGSNQNEINRVYFEDFWKEADAISTPVTLQIYETIYDTFMGKELLGRITDRSVTVNLYSLIKTDTYIEYGTTPGIYTNTTPRYLNQAAEQPVEIILDDLAPDTRYYYRLSFRKTGDRYYEHGKEHAFHTQRPPASTFVFTITADEHFPYRLPQNKKKLNLYRQTFQNIAESNPDFLISLGDFAMTDWCSGRWIKNLGEAKQRYLNLRSCLNNIAHSIPFYLVIGNHEGEVGWEYDFTAPGQNHDSRAVICTKARKEIMPNPYPDEFYTGNTDLVSEYGLREDYFAWEWGDALFVALDPFWYTKTNPKVPADGWEWTLGKEQYDWLYQTLHNSDAKWKLVFIHHLTSSYTDNLHNRYTSDIFYGRGGTEIAKFKVAGQPSFEWGGEDKHGVFVFDVKRTDWTHGSIHDMLVSENVTAVFHGHDHLFAKQDLDGIVYQECPRPSNATYGFGFMLKSGYKHGVIHNNSGHIQVTVDPHSVKVEYVRSFLPGDGENGIVAYSYEINSN
jgi:hypothetical protein